jgi:hypothetical protein
MPLFKLVFTPLRKDLPKCEFHSLIRNLDVDYLNDDNGFAKELSLKDIHTYIQSRKIDIMIQSPAWKGANWWVLLKENCITIHYGKNAIAEPAILIEEIIA